MLAEDSPNGLPTGWIMKEKVRNKGNVKHFCNVETGQTFYSKEDVLRYVEMANASGVTSQPTEMGHVSYGSPQPIEMGNVNPATPQADSNKTRPRKKSVPTVVKSKEVSEWLPDGWITELKIRKNGSEQKCYIDPTTGCKFYSKPQVSRYLETLNNGMAELDKIGTSSDRNPNAEYSNEGKSSSKPDASPNREIIKSNSGKPRKKKVGVGKDFNAVIERGPADGLPPGWIKEIRVRTKKTANVNKTDPYYIDPTSGYIFRSQLDALRYVETGDIYKCAIKPRKGDMNDLEFINANTSSPSAVDKKKSTDNTTGRKLFAGIESSTEAPEAENVEENRSLDNTNERKESETNKISDPQTKVPKRKRSIEVSAEKGSVSTPVNGTLQEEKSPENEMAKRINKKTEKKNAISSPSRSSKRLSGVKPEMMTNLGLNERALRAAARKGGETEVGSHSDLGSEALVGQAVHEEKPERQEESNRHTNEMEKSQNLELENPLMESLRDPSLEFAFKNFTGEQAVTCDDFVDYFSLPDGGNFTLPSCSSMAPQQSVLDGLNKENQNKVN